MEERFLIYLLCALIFVYRFLYKILCTIFYTFLIVLTVVICKIIRQVSINNVRSLNEKKYMMKGDESLRNICHSGRCEQDTILCSRHRGSVVESIVQPFNDGVAALDAFTHYVSTGHCWSNKSALSFLTTGYKKIKKAYNHCESYNAQVNHDQQNNLSKINNIEEIMNDLQCKMGNLRDQISSMECNRDCIIAEIEKVVSNIRHIQESIIMKVNSLNEQKNAQKALGATGIGLSFASIATCGFSLIALGVLLSTAATMTTIVLALGVSIADNRKKLTSMKDDLNNLESAHAEKNRAIEVTKMNITKLEKEVKIVNKLKLYAYEEDKKLKQYGRKIGTISKELKKVLTFITSTCGKMEVLVDQMNYFNIEAMTIVFCDLADMLNQPDAVEYQWLQDGSNDFQQICNNINKVFEIVPSQLTGGLNLKELTNGQSLEEFS